MKIRISLVITSVVQGIYLLFILLNLLFIYMFSVGVPYTYPFTILGSVVLQLCPVEVFCLIANVVILIIDRRTLKQGKKLLSVFIAAILPFALIIIIKYFQFRYADILVGVV